MSILAYIVIALAIFAGGAAGGIKWHAGQDAIAAEKARDQADQLRRMDEKRIDVAATGHEADKRQIEIQYREVAKEVERVVEKPVYRDVCFDDDGLRVLGTAIRPADAASQPARAVPGPSPTR